MEMIKLLNTKLVSQDVKNVGKNVTGRNLAVNGNLPTEMEIFIYVKD